MPASRRGYRPNSEEVASEVLDGEAVLINLSNGMYYSIDGVGCRIWELVAENLVVPADRPARRPRMRRPMHDDNISRRRSADSKKEFLRLARDGFSRPGCARRNPS